MRISHFIWDGDVFMALRLSNEREDSMKLSLVAFDKQNRVVQGANIGPPIKVNCYISREYIPPSWRAMREVEIEGGFIASGRFALNSVLTAIS